MGITHQNSRLYLGAFFNDRDFRHLSEKYPQAYENIATQRSSRLIPFVYQWRHSIIFLESFAVITCPVKTVFVGYSRDITIGTKQCGKAFFQSEPGSINYRGIAQILFKEQRAFAFATSAVIRGAGFLFSWIFTKL